MSEVFLAFGWNNLMVSAGLALIAWVVQRDGRSPFLAHLLWLLVLAKLVTPPLWGVGMVEVPWQSAEQVAMEQQAVDLIAASLQPASTGSETVLSTMVLPAPTTATAVEVAPEATSLWSSTQQVLFGLWIAGSLLVFVISSYRIWRFQRLLHWGTSSAPAELQQQVGALAKRLGLRRPPRVLLSEARLAPLVWCLFGRPRLVLPAHLLEELDAEQMEWVLAHELTHIRRRDHLVRWLEWLACVAFWWNPIAWWARKNLRAHEEICCDAQVLRSLRAEPRAYAASLLQVAASLAPPDVRPPAVASAFTDGGELERRFHMILSKNPLTRISRRLQAVVLLGAVALLPLGIATAQEPDYEAVHKRLSLAVEAGELSAPQAEAMLAALKSKAVADQKAVGKRLGDAVSAGELTPEQAKAMMMVLVGESRNSQLPAGGARALHSFSDQNGSSLDQQERLLLEREQLLYKEQMQKMLARQDEYLQHAKDLETHYSNSKARTQKLLENGFISQSEAELKLIALQEKLWNSEKQLQETMEYLKLQERMQEMERNLHESQLRYAEVEALRNAEQLPPGTYDLLLKDEAMLQQEMDLLQQYAEALQAQVGSGTISEKDSQEILDAARKDALENRWKLQLKEQQRKADVEALESAAWRKVEDMPAEPIQPHVENPRGSRR